MQKNGSKNSDVVKSLHSITISFPTHWHNYTILGYFSEYWIAMNNFVEMYYIYVPLS